MSELLCIFSKGFRNKSIVFVCFYQVNGTASETASHHTRTSYAAFFSNVVQEVKFFTAYFIQFAHAVMRTIHFFSDSFVVTFFQCITDIQYALNFFNDIFSTHIIFCTNIGLNFIQHVHGSVSQEFYFRMITLNGSYYVFARLTTFVVCRRSQFMFNH